MKTKINLFFLIASILCSFSSKATVVYVDSAHVGGLQNGSSWATAFSDFQSGINAANAGDSVWVAKGTYKTPLDSSFEMKEGVKIFGGFMNTHSNISQRNWQNNKTILKGRNSGNGDITSIGMASSSVILNIYNHLTNETVIDGFTITGGYAANGGGMRNLYSSPTISNCTFTQNTAGSGGGIFFGKSSACQITNCIFDQNSAYAGGGINSDESNLTITNCIFSHNISPAITGGYGDGGGIYSFISQMVIRGCIFLENEVESDENWFGEGGGIRSSSSSNIIDSCFFIGNTAYGGGGAVAITTLNDGINAVIRNCSFNNNMTIGRGGAIYLASLESSIIEHNIFYGNKAAGTYGRGGAISNSYSSPKINNCSFINNSAKFGGVLLNYSDNGPIMVNCLFAENVADSFGAVVYSTKGMFNDSTGYTILNCTISKNVSSSDYGEVLYNDINTTATISNSIIWGNTGGIINADITGSYNSSYSLIQGETTNALNYNLDGNTNPLFNDTTIGDFRLRFDSPSINKGNNDSIPALILTDLAGNNRIVYDTVDMGAYEYKLAISLGNDTVICNENGLTLNADNLGSAYLWGTGDTTQSITVSSSGIYTVEVSNTWGTVTDTIQVNISSPPVVSLGNDATINQGSSITLEAGNPGATYLWNTGAATQTINVTTSGTYSVVVTDSAGCTGSDTIVVNVDPVGINDINTSGNSLIISPNPAKETIRINFTDEKLLHTKAILTDIYGRTVREVMLNSKSQQLSMAGLTSGVYILKTITGNSVKIIKQ